VKPPNRRIVLLIGLLAVPAGPLLYFLWWLPQRMEQNEQAAILALKVIVAAEADFRANDRDGNRVHDYWVGDVAGLSYLRNPAGREIQLIDQDLADADAAALKPVGTRKPYRGYWFVVMKTDDSQGKHEPYGEDTDGTGSKLKSTTRFGVCAYPAEYGRTGRWTYFVNEYNSSFKRELGGRPLLEWPQDDPSKFSYSPD
jgi:hypothetical protein